MSQTPDLDFINEQAMPEGWFISHVGATDDMYRLERDDEMQVFGNDAEAWAHVCKRALEGSDLHQAALLYLKGSEGCTQEWQFINTHAVTQGLIAPLEEVV